MMNNLILVFICLILGSNKICNSETQPYEPGQDACDRCNCSKKINNEVYILNCAERNLKQILSSYGNLFEANVEGLDQIADITFSGNAIKSLNPLPKTDAKISFSCRHCQLTEIAEDAFKNVPNILTIDLSYNQLTENTMKANVIRGKSNDDGSFKSMNILSLDLSNNNIESLNERVFLYAKSLRRLSLSRNPFKNLSETTIIALASLTNLVRLDLSYTELTEIPDALLNGTMPQLRELNIEGNHLIRVPESVACLKSSLRTLYIGKNPIRSLEDESFLGLKSLTRLYIDNMPELTKIYAGTFSSLDSLEVLNCSNNPKLLEFDLGHLAWSQYLREIYLSNCSMTMLQINLPKLAPLNESDTFPLNRLKFLKLDNNPWQCDCNLFKSLEKIKSHNQDLFIHNGGARCETPYELISDLLTDLTVDTSCKITNIKKPYRTSAYELPPFLRPRSLLVTLCSILIVVIIGLCIGLCIVHVKKKLLNSDIGFATPIRYTTVRNSTGSVQQ